ncbi:MAG: LysM peptidoglycan-binding domain-containing protein [Kiritimatiellae bacterium]|nr:LysM peptidoglycan-binding domain-containing protein [Kiritimatiellia bacterium]
MGIFSVVTLTGCGRDAASLDKQEENDPALRRARVRKKAQDIDGAIDLYNKALDRKPQLARAHLEVGLLYDSYKEDYNRAIYHYQRYLELRPDSEKEQLIQDLIRRARLSYAVSLPDTPPGAIEEIAELRKENASLKARLAELVRVQGDSAATAVVESAAPRAATLEPHRQEVSPAPKPAPAQPPVRTYRVQKGDTLSSISGKMYNDSNAWRKIYDANRNSMKSPSSLTVGQTLIIPQ